MHTDLPKVSDVGIKKNSKGYKVSWTGYRLQATGYKLHIDMADGSIPISAVLISTLYSVQKDDSSGAIIDLLRFLVGNFASGSYINVYMTALKITT